MIKNGLFHELLKNRNEEQITTLVNLTKSISTFYGNTISYKPIHSYINLKCSKKHMTLLFLWAEEFEDYWLI